PNPPRRRASGGPRTHPAAGLRLAPPLGQPPREQPPGVLRVHVGEALAGLVDVDQQDGDQLAFGPAWRVGRWGGAGQSPLLPRASYGSCDPSLAPSRDRHLAPADAMAGHHHQRYLWGLNHRSLYGPRGAENA